MLRKRSVAFRHGSAPRFPEGPGDLDLYRVADGHIAQAWSVAGKKRLFH